MRVLTEILHFPIHVRLREVRLAKPINFALLHFARSSHEDYGPFRTRDNGGCYELINVRGRVKLYKIMSC